MSLSDSEALSENKHAITDYRGSKVGLLRARIARLKLYY